MAHWQRLVLAGAALQLSACASLVEVRPMATGRPDVSAYELRGSDVAVLKREAQKQCPQGADILRQAGRSDQRPAAADAGRLGRWANATGNWLSPPRREAQLVVVCKEAAADLRLPALADEVADATADTPAAGPLPPITVEW